MRRVRRIPVGFLAVCLLALFASRAQAQRTFEFVTDQSNYTVLPNGTATVNIFLRETIAGSSTSILVTEGSIVTEGVRITRTTSPSAPTVITAAQSDSFFNFANDSVQSGGAQADLNAANLQQGASAPVINDTSSVRRVRFGQITVQAGLIPLQTTTFTLADNPSTGDTATQNGTPLDSLIQARTFTVSVLPEPTTAASLFVAAGFLLIRRRVRP